MLGAHLWHAALQRGNEMALFSVIPEAKVKNICVIFCYKVPRYIYLRIAGCAKKKTQRVRCQACAESCRGSLLVFVAFAGEEVAYSCLET